MENAGRHQPASLVAVAATRRPQRLRHAQADDVVVPPLVRARPLHLHLEPPVLAHGAQPPQPRSSAARPSPATLLPKRVGHLDVPAVQRLVHRGLVVVVPTLAQPCGRLVSPRGLQRRCSCALRPLPLAQPAPRRRSPLGAVLVDVRRKPIRLQQLPLPPTPLGLCGLLPRECGAHRRRRRLALLPPAAPPPSYRLPGQPRSRVELPHD